MWSDARWLLKKSELTLTNFVRPALENFPSGFSLFENDLEHIVSHLSDSQEGLRGAHVFITGGTGFFGIWLIESLLWANTRLDLKLKVSVLSRSPESFLTRFPHLRSRDDLVFVAGSMIDFPTVGQIYTHIIHAASETNLAGSSDWSYRHFRTAMDGTHRLLDMAATHRTDGVLLTTSGAVYLGADLAQNDRFVEAQAGISDYLSEKHLYGQTKRTMEVMACLEASRNDFRALIARCFCFVGPYLPLEGNYAAGNFLRDALEKKPIIIQGDGTPLRSYLYMSDLVIWLLKILVKGRTGAPYNVGGERAVSIAELATDVAEQAGRPGTVSILKTPIPGARSSAYLPSIDRARSELGLEVWVDLPEAISKTLAWFRMREYR